MRKFNEENERIKRAHARWLRDVQGRDQATIDIALAAIFRFEESTGFKNFKKFNLDQPSQFKTMLGRCKNQRTGTPLSKATIDSTLRHVRNFFRWIAGERGYKSHIRYADAAYFNNNLKDARIAHAERETPYPTLEQCSHAFRQMPEGNEFERRDKALFAFLMITGARDGAIASLKLKSIDLVDGSVYQDARDVKTKGAKTFTTWFFPMGELYRTCFYDWVNYLKNEALFGNGDALFPKPRMGLAKTGGFTKLGLSRQNYANANMIRKTIKRVFASAGLPEFGPHSFRKMLVAYGDSISKDRQQFKAWSMNIGHESVTTTILSYMPISSSRQAELIKGMNQSVA